MLRGAYEEGRILASRQPIVEVLQEPGLDPVEAEKLRLVLMVRDFAARELDLDVGGSYRTLAPIGPDQTIYVLSAAPRFELRLYTWWFPFVGDMPYKGYFSEADAREESAAMEKEGYDTIVLPVAAFSTLGWFDDPMPSTLLKHDDVTLTNIVLHELTHNTYYAPGQAAFNESFANFVGGRGAIAFFEQLDGVDGPRAVEARAVWHDDLLYSAFLGQLIPNLSAEYARGITLAQRDDVFRAEQERFRALPWETESRRGVGKIKLNNALLLHQWVYHTDLAAFETVFADSKDDLAAAIAVTIARVRGADDPYAALH